METTERFTRQMELRHERDFDEHGPNEWAKAHPEKYEELQKLETEWWGTYLSERKPWTCLRESNLTEVVPNLSHDARDNAGALLFDGHWVAEIASAEFPMWLDLFAAAPGMFAAIERLLAAPDLNEDSLSPETIKAIDDANHVLNRVKKGRPSRVPFLTAEERSRRVLELQESLGEMLSEAKALLREYNELRSAAREPGEVEAPCFARARRLLGR